MKRQACRNKVSLSFYVPDIFWVHDEDVFDHASRIRTDRSWISYVGSIFLEQLIADDHLLFPHVVRLGNWSPFTAIIIAEVDGIPVDGIGA